MDYTTLSLADVHAGLSAVAGDAQSAFGSLDARQLNWRPDSTRWSVAQCLEHLLAANRLMRDAAERALDDRTPPTLWERMPVLPRVFGRMLIRSQTPQVTRRFVASPLAMPAASDVSSDVVGRFVAQDRELVSWLRALDEDRLARVIMTSPFVRVITYSVLDGARLMLTHDHRHMEQARRVMQSAGFP